MVSLLKGDHGNAQMAGCPDVSWWLTEPSTAEALWVLMHINEMGAITLRQEVEKIILREVRISSREMRLN